ncbi:N-acetylglucosaminephosphotransferase [Clavulina sp. PMI_390]|nr:N-acetylglucosaminephosphotransferase [Clavulina sp. PMI_390]
MSKNWFQYALAPLAFTAIITSILYQDIPLSSLYSSIGFAILAFLATSQLIPIVSPHFVTQNLKGKDRLKPNGPEIAESVGLICACVYIACMILFIPFLFTDFMRHRHDNTVGLLTSGEFPHRQLAMYLAAIMSLLSATLLGFLDDVFDIRWRYKLPIPLIASVPLLLVYFAEGGNTHVVLPRFVRSLFGTTILNLGPLYYIYMSMLSTFCTNSINILAGVNGIEASQALVIAVSIAANDLLYLPWPFTFKVASLHLGGVYGAGMAWGSKELVDRHLLSLYFMLPMIGVCWAFLRYNWYPARAFPGDTLCYFAGMTFAVVGILGHFSKTLLLFFIPQVFNFVISCPQLFGVVPCPRHRMPVFDEKKGVLVPSKFKIVKRPTKVVRLGLQTLASIGIVRLEWDDDGELSSSTNLTLLNCVLVARGPTSEPGLVRECIMLQTMGSLAAFTIRYGLVGLFYSAYDDRR